METEEIQFNKPNTDYNRELPVACVAWCCGLPASNMATVLVGRPNFAAGGPAKGQSCRSTAPWLASP